MARDFDIPFLGLYGACSTIAEGLCIGSMIVAGGFARLVAVTSSSHHDTAERQYRYPTEFGYQRAPTNQWTVTLAGAALLSATGKGPAVEAITVGRVLDYGISDANDMGSAMAPAFADTVFRHLADMSRKPHDYDIIVSGDLGAVGSMVARHMLSDKGVDLGNIYYDAGLMIYDSKSDLKAGASGCGCAAGILSVKLWPGLNSGKYKRVLLVATGALHSPTSTQQGESIPCIAHAVSLVCRD